MLSSTGLWPIVYIDQPIINYNYNYSSPTLDYYVLCQIMYCGLWVLCIGGKKGLHHFWSCKQKHCNMSPYRENGKLLSFLNKLSLNVIVNHNTWIDKWTQVTLNMPGVYSKTLFTSWWNMLIKQQHNNKLVQCVNRCFKWCTYSHFKMYLHSLTACRV